MRARRPAGNSSARSRVRASRAALAAVAILIAVGCSSPAKTLGSSRPASGSPTTATGTPCGITRTAANVPIDVQVARGQVSCPTAMTVERDYAKAIEDGRAPGNGGGGPVNVKGWTCQGFATPVVLKTGNASKCVRGGSVILAVLPSPT